MRVAIGMAAVMTEATPFLPRLSPVGRKPLTAFLDAGNLTSNGGLLAAATGGVQEGATNAHSHLPPITRRPEAAYSFSGSGSHGRPFRPFVAATISFEISAALRGGAD